MALAPTHSAHSSSKSGSTSVFAASSHTNPTDVHDFTAAPYSHKRTYQACIPCRRRKVRCDLGPVDDPHEPPCVRCRRESKECYFSATRRKRKSQNGDYDAEGNDDINDDYAIRNSRRKTSYASASSNTPQSSLQAAGSHILSRSKSRSPPEARYNSIRAEFNPDVKRIPEPYYINTSIDNEGPGQDQEVTNETAAALFQTPINTPGDALHLLLEASGRSEDLQLHEKLGRGTQNNIDVEPPSSSRNYHVARPQLIDTTKDPDSMANLDPAIATDGPNITVFDSSRETLRIWSRLRFVRAGWFTADEALEYVNYFYEFLSPLTPISPPDFRLASTTSNLVDEEPILAVTILTIAARYKKLTGSGGQTRSFMIHEKLWRFLQNMITRMYWGQEHFGGGFSMIGSRNSAQKGMEKGKLRSLGTIESLLLLSEFHPRSMHFPASDDGGDILASMEGDSIIDDVRDGPATRESTFAGWIEPALRSDRMCWSLIGTAYTLAYELGVFGNYAEGTQPIDGGINRRIVAQGHRQRAGRIERLLYIYITQTSGRLGFPSAFPGYIGDTDLAKFDGAFFASDQISPQDNVETIQQSWAEITSIGKASNAALFSSKVKTTDLIKSGEYIGRLQQLQPILTSWQKKLQSLDVHKSSKTILSIEFEYARVYINSLALQAVLEHWTAKAGEGGKDHAVNQPGTSTPGYLAGSYSKNDYYIREVVDASRNLLRHVVDGLFLDDNLKHAPVRVYMRILSGAMFLLKTFALGAKEDEVTCSLNLLDGTIKALRTSVVDDVHLSLRIADLLEGLTSSIRHRFVRLARQPSNKHPNAFPDKTRSQYPSGKGSQEEISAGNNENDPARPANNIQDPALTDPNDYSFAIIPPRDTAYNFPTPYDPSSTYSNNNNNNNNPPNPTTTTGPYDYQPPYANTNPSAINDEDWLTLDLNPLLADTGTGGFGSWTGDGTDWIGGFGPEITSNLEVLGKLANDGYRSEGWEGGFVG